MSEPARADITVCIPAYRSAAFIEQTLQAVSAQSYGNFRALVSLDGHDPATEDVCRRFGREDCRFELVIQPERLGWLGNTNALLDRVSTEFFCIMPHDDLIAATYLEKLRSEAIAHPEALVSFCDMERVGGRPHDVVSTPALDGPFRDRLASLLLAQTEGVAWRGLTRASVLQAGRRMRSNAFEAYNAHALWVIELLCLGPFRRVPEPLYRQRVRVHPHGVTTGWHTWTPERRYSALAEYILQCIELVSTTGEAQPPDRHAIIALLLLKLLTNPGAFRNFSPRGKSVDRDLLRLAELFGRGHALDYLAPNDAEQLRDDPALRIMMSKLRVAEAVEALAAGDLVQANATLESASALDPENAEVHVRKIQLLRRLGDHDAALKVACKAVALFPSEARAQLELARVYAVKGDLEEAVIASRAALQLAPKLVAAYMQLGAVLLRLGRLNEALDVANKALSVDPDHAGILAQRQTIAARMGR